MWGGATSKHVGPYYSALSYAMHVCICHVRVFAFLLLGLWRMILCFPWTYLHAVTCLNAHGQARQRSYTSIIWNKNMHVYMPTCELFHFSCTDYATFRRSLLAEGMDASSMYRNSMPQLGRPGTLVRTCLCMCIRCIYVLKHVHIDGTHTLQGKRRPFVCKNNQFGTEGSSPNCLRASIRTCAYTQCLCNYVHT